MNEDDDEARIEAAWGDPDQLAADRRFDEIYWNRFTDMEGK
jgi:hypothetical protein